MAQKPTMIQDPELPKNADGRPGPDGASSYLSRLTERFYVGAFSWARQKRTTQATTAYHNLPRAYQEPTERLPAENFEL